MIGKKGALTAMSLATIVFIVIAGLIVYNVIGVAVLISKLNENPIIWVAIILLIIAVLTKLKGK